MRILMATTQWPPDVGGAERTIFGLAQELSKHKDIDINILTLTRDPQKIKGVTFHNIPRKPIPTLYYATLGSDVLKRFEDMGFDIIHSHMPLPWGWLFRKSHSKKIITLHGEIMIDKSFLFSLLAKNAFKSVDAIVSPSTRMSAYLKERFGFEAMLIRNGIEMKNFKSTKKQLDNVILFVGRYVELKGIFEIIEVARQLPQFEFWFAGSGPLDPYLDLPNIRNLGFIENARMGDIYRQATLCLFPSHIDAYPTVAMEAMTCGRAIVASKVFSEIIVDGHNGILVDPGDIDAIKDAVLELMNDRIKRNRIEDAAATDSKGFSVKNMADRYYRLYKKII